MKLPKKNEFGDYVYRGLNITNIGYDRIIGHVRWSVTDATGRSLFQTDTLRDAIRRIDIDKENEGETNE